MPFVFLLLLITRAWGAQWGAWRQPNTTFNLAQTGLLLIKVKWPWKPRLLLSTEFSALYKSIFSQEKLWDNLQSLQGILYAYMLSQSPRKPQIKWSSVFVQNLPNCGCLEAGENRLNLPHVPGPPSVIGFVSAVNLRSSLRSPVTREMIQLKPCDSVDQWFPDFWFHSPVKFKKKSDWLGLLLFCFTK